MLPITSLQNPRVKNAVRLRDGRHRQKQGRFPIDGARELGRAMRAGVELIEVFVCEALCESEEALDVLRMLPDGKAEVIEVNRAVFDKLSFGGRAEGVLGVAAIPGRTLADIHLPTNPLVAVLEGVEKPGNVGAVLRSADAVGASALIVADGRTDLFNPNAIRASLGTIFSVPCCEATSADTLAWLRRHRFHIFAARVDGSVPYTEVAYPRPTAIVLGSEASGLSDLWSTDDVTAVRLPMRGTADSLNVSVTAAVLLYEMMKVE